MFRPLCVCGIIAKTRLDLSQMRTHVVILMHVREVPLPTSTARLMVRALQNSEIRLRGVPDQPLKTEGLVVSERQSLLLYPSDEALELNAETLSRFDRPITLIVPDGSWRQARKVAVREPSLHGLPQVKLPAGPPSRYRLRKEPNEQSVSTFEAIARALGIIEGAAVQTQLEDLFDMRVERTLWSRGMLKEEECRFGIPQAAYDAFRVAGCRGGENAKRLLAERRAQLTP